MQIEHSSQFVKARQPNQVGILVYLMQNLPLRGNFTRQMAVLRFWAPLWGLRGNVRWSSYGSLESA